MVRRGGVGVKMGSEIIHLCPTFGVRRFIAAFSLSVRIGVGKGKKAAINGRTPKTLSPFLCESAWGKERKRQ
jgi:predicted fused transcriptional regulator/phosphomethylpyrimidine kinase